MKLQQQQTPEQIQAILAKLKRRDIVKLEAFDVGYNYIIIFNKINEYNSIEASCYWSSIELKEPIQTTSGGSFSRITKIAKLQGATIPKYVREFLAKNKEVVNEPSSNS